MEETVTQSLLSLEECCYLHIVANLHFQPLGHLPYSLRHRILTRLPAIDLQLVSDNVRLWQNLDKDNYWKLAYYRLNGPSQLCRSNWKSAYLEQIGRLIHQGGCNIQKAIYSLFSVPYDFALSSDHQNSLFLSSYGFACHQLSHNTVKLFPCHLLTLLNCNVQSLFGTSVESLLAVIKVLVCVFKWYSSTVHINTLTTSLFNMTGGDCYYIEQYYSKATSLNVVCLDRNQYQEVLPYLLVKILTNITSPSGPHLKFLSIVDSDHRHNLQYSSVTRSYLSLQLLVGYFCKGFGRPYGAPNHPCYSGLEDISVSTSFFQTVMTPLQKQQNMSFFNMLAAIIRNQKQLCSVRIEAGLIPTVNCSCLIQTLVDFVSKDSFRNLTLDSSSVTGTMVLPTDLSVKLFLEFLNSTSTHEQSIGLHGVMFMGPYSLNLSAEDISKFKKTLEMRKGNKTIYLVNSEITDSLAPFISHVPQVFTSIEVT